MTTYMLDSAAEQDDRPFECPTCGLPAHIEDRFTLAGAPSPVEHVKLVCVAGHWCTPPVDQLPGRSLSCMEFSAHVALRRMREMRQRSGTHTASQGCS